MNIDFIIYWVDGSEKEWQQKKASYKGTEYQNEAARYRDWDILRYWFRAVEEYAPWVHRVFFVADNQRPKWLNFKHPKLVYVDHKDFIPKQYLPTFNANTIELNIHRIKGLSEHFVVFNDDMFINAPISPEYYFHNGLPCDATLEHVFNGRCYDEHEEWGINIIEYCCTHVLNAHFDRKITIRENWKAWLGGYLGFKYQFQAWLITLFGRHEFQHFYTPHNEKAFLKTVCEEAWEKESVMLGKSCTRFRENISLSNYFLRYWHLASNRFYPTSMKGRRVIPICEKNMNKIHAALFDTKAKSLCLNDSSFCTDGYFDKAKQMLIQWFEQKFPHQSSFEI